jgi:hypothetical protein
MLTQLSVIQLHQSSVWPIHDDADDGRWSPPHRVVAPLPRHTHELLGLNRRYAATNGAAEQSVLTHAPALRRPLLRVPDAREHVHRLLRREWHPVHLLVPENPDRGVVDVEDVITNFNDATIIYIG